MSSRGGSRYAAACMICMVLVVQALAGSGYTILKRFPIPSSSEATWDHITIDESSKKLYLAHDTQVEAVNADTGKILGIITGTKNARAVAVVPELKRGYITNGDTSTVIVFDLDTLKKLAEIPVGESPDFILYDPSTKRVFSINGGNATAIDAAEGKAAATIDLEGKPEQAVADGAGHVFVVVKDKALVARIDSRRLVVDQRWRIPGGDRPTSIDMDKKNHRLFVGCRDLALYVMDSENGRVITQAAIGDNVDTTAFDPASGLVFSSTEDGLITVVHEDGPDSYSVVDTVKTQAGSKTLALDHQTHLIYMPYGEEEKLLTGASKTGGRKNRSGVSRKVVANSYGVLVIGKQGDQSGAASY